MIKCHFIQMIGVHNRHQNRHIVSKQSQLRNWRRGKQTTLSGIEPATFRSTSCDCEGLLWPRFSELASILLNVLVARLTSVGFFRIREYLVHRVIMQMAQHDLHLTPDDGRKKNSGLVISSSEHFYCKRRSFDRLTLTKRKCVLAVLTSH